MIKIRVGNYSPRRVVLLGYGLFTIGLVFLAQDLAPQILYGYRPSLGEITGDSAIALAGVAVIVIGNSLKQLDERLRGLEASMEVKKIEP